MKDNLQENILTKIVKNLMIKMKENMKISYFKNHLLMTHINSKEF